MKISKDLLKIVKNYELFQEINNELDKLIPELVRRDSSIAFHSYCIEFTGDICLNDDNEAGKKIIYDFVDLIIMEYGVEIMKEMKKRYKDNLEFYNNLLKNKLKEMGE